MKALLKESSEPGLVLKDVTKPKAGKGELLVKVKAASICGSDLHLYEWNRWAKKRLLPPMIIGHEFVGDVEEIGIGVSGFEKGDLVSCETHIFCGYCRQCRLGQRHLCANTKVIGFDRQGAFAEYISIPAVCAWLTTPELDLYVAALQEPFGNAVHATLSAPIAGSNILVTGGGPIGIMAVTVARACGASKIIVSEPNEYRRNLALKMGANKALDPDHEDLVEGVQLATKNIGIDVLLEMSGSPRALSDGLSALRAGGFAALMGIPDDVVQLDITDNIIFKGVTLKGIIGRKLFESWYQGQAMLTSGKVNLAPLVTHRFQIENFKEAFDIGLSGDCGKIVFTI